jgi:tetratricopeptide (TPR) repeat protein
MVSSRIINNDDEYIEGLLDSSPAIIDAIYKRFARKVKHMVTGWGGSIKDSAHVFEGVLLSIYNYAQHHKLNLTNHFEPFFLYACQLKWKQEMMEKSPNKAQSFHPKPPAPGLDALHIKYIEDALTTQSDHMEADNTRNELEEMIADQREKWFHTKDHGANTKVGMYVVITAIISAGLAGLLFLSPWHKDVYRQFSGTEMIHHNHVNAETDTALLIHKAAIAFNKGHYDKAIVILNQVLQKDSTQPTARYYRGVSLIDEHQPEAARKDLMFVYEGSSSYKYDAAFYIALSYLRERDKQQCMEWLMKIPANAPNYWKVERLREELASS